MDPVTTRQPLGLLLVAVEEPSHPLRACWTEVGRRWERSHLDVELLVQQTATSNSSESSLTMRALGRPPHVVAVWADAGQFEVAHRVLREARRVLSDGTRATLLGPDVSEKVRGWTKTNPDPHRRLLDDVGTCLTGDPVAELEALVRDAFRVESRPLTISGLVWLDERGLRINPTRRPQVNRLGCRDAEA